jgi:hypothetical protein
MKPIILSNQERRDLIAFKETLTGVPEAEAPPKLWALPVWSKKLKRPRVRSVFIHPRPRGFGGQSGTFQ